MTVARRVRIHGRVQGVWYRGWAVDTARSLGLAGWVRNRGDGTVEAVVQGDEQAVESFIRLAHRGSPNAQVSQVEVAPEEHDPSLGGFRQTPTA